MSAVRFRPISPDCSHHGVSPHGSEYREIKERARSLSPLLDEKAMDKWCEQEAGRNLASLDRFVSIPSEADERWPSKALENMKTFASHLNLIPGCKKWNDRRAFEMMLKAISQLSFSPDSREFAICRDYCQLIETSRSIAQLEFGNRYLHEGKERRLLASWIQMHLEALVLDQSLFLPSGYADHTVGLLITRESGSQFSALALDSSRYTPFIHFSPIDESEILDITLWDELLFASSYEETTTENGHTVLRSFEKLVPQVKVEEYDDRMPFSNEGACAIFAHLLLIYHLCSEMEDPEAYERIEKALKAWVSANLENLNPGVIGEN